ncbi:hypothetical protein COJ96_10735 [Bacillus sp. AFS073361]|uniref:hypothetical protein n=1 Tax=Bacillus sp. AFS073361 TaxID=2033511 RepID=UPI000BF30CAE|nr:hypothetical protein [Bacillus sp. AFS073361]PFP29372.1 hypothetical protein COJ96_10735 [Bacillus sp. AFS073361]
MREIENPMVIDRLWHNTVSDDYFADVLDLDENVNCCICGEENYKEEANESEIWEDTYLCDSGHCHNIHYQGWSESVELGRYYKIEKSIHRASEHSFMGKQI